MACLACGFALASHAGSLVGNRDANAFFNTVAGELLRVELSADLNRIQLYPTNEYTPQLHRYLKLAANIYECTTNRTETGYPHLPTLFRPLFTNDSGSVFICGYTAVSGTNVLAAPLRDLTESADRAALELEDRVLGVPFIIGVRKGYPNFNEAACETKLRIARRLEFRRLPWSGPIDRTNVMYTAEISNQFGVECWNPYTNSFPRDLKMLTSATVSFRMTNEHGSLLVTNVAELRDVRMIPAGQWPAYLAGPTSPSFLLPLTTNWVTLPLSAYSSSLEQFVSATDSFEQLPSLPAPSWWAQVRVSVNHALVDAIAGEIVDYVSLDSTTPPYDLTSMLMLNASMQIDPCGPLYLPSGSPGSLWCTNRFNPYDQSLPTFGMLNQIQVGLANLPSSVWPMQTNIAAINFFRAQFDLSPLSPYQFFPKTNLFYCPFSPVQDVFLSTWWSAADPLVHHTPQELSLDVHPWTFQFMDLNLGRVNVNYEPWSLNYSSTRNNLTLKDPAVFSAETWDFPENQVPDLSWISRVHRGTPWQTVYWKSGAVSPDQWADWLRMPPWDAISLMPTNDWRLVEILAPLFNANYLHFLTSINQPDAAGFADLIDGIQVYTNSTANQLDSMTLQAGSPQGEAIAAAMLAGRAQQPNGFFQSVGDCFAVPQLSLASPFIRPRLASAPADRAFEAIPSQLAVRARPDSIGRATGSPLRIRFSGLDDYTYRVEESTDLVHWITVSTNRPAKGWFDYLPGNSGARRFYRSVLLPESPPL